MVTTIFREVGESVRCAKEGISRSPTQHAVGLPSRSVTISAVRMHSLYE